MGDEVGCGVYGWVYLLRCERWMLFLVGLLSGMLLRN